MCYDKEYLARKAYNYAKRYAQDPAEIEDLKEQLSIFQPTYYVSGFSHPTAPVITNEEPGRIQGFTWGLIPFWVKENVSAVKLSNQCLNARGETIFEKPAFRESAKSKRCLITCIDGYFEYYHHQNKIYPFFIRLKSQEAMTFAGLWSRWENREEGIVRYTYSIVTTKANTLISKIHNNPNRENGDSRMPVILPQELERQWLQPINDKADKEIIENLIQPYQADLMEAYPVGQLKGKNGVGNKEQATEKMDYSELDLVL